MAASEPFTFVTESEDGQLRLFGDYKDLTSGHVADIDVQMIAALRKKHPELIVTTIPGSNVDLLYFAAAGYARFEVDTETESIIRWRGFVPPPPRGGNGSIGEAVFFAKYHYKWGQEDFILYTVKVGYSLMQYVLKEPRGEESTLSTSAVTDKLIMAAGQAFLPKGKNVYVFDGYWSISSDLWRQVEKTTWDDVILDSDMKRELTSVTEKFFDSKEIYKEYGVPWKRGLIFHGPVGNGKTISIKALMHTLGNRDDNIPCLYVKSAPATYYIGAVFAFARQMSPCFLVLEDIESIVNSSTRSYFFNEVDGLANNDGIMMVATTNYLDRLDPGLKKRPSRFDRKYLFPLPSLGERTQYCEFWRKKLASKDIEFPKKLCHAIARITGEFSFAYMQEAFVATLLEIARQSADIAMGILPNSDSDDDGDDDDDLEKYILWRVMRKQVKLLREDMESLSSSTSPISSDIPPVAAPSEPQLLSAMDHASSAIGGLQISQQRGNGLPQGFQTSLPHQAGLTFCGGLNPENDQASRQQSALLSTLPDLRQTRGERSPGPSAQALEDIMIPYGKRALVNPRAYQYQP